MATVESAGLTPGLVGLYKVNMGMPEGVPAEDQASVVLTVFGQSSQPVTIAVQSTLWTGCSAARSRMKT